MGRIRFEPAQGQMAGSLTQIPAFPGERFGLGFPEAIGDAARACWFGSLTPHWEQQADSDVWQCTGRKEGELAYTIVITPHEDAVDARFTLTNESNRTWSQSLAFNCFQCGAAASVRDHECTRHWVRTGGAFKRLIEVPRVFGPRPAIQLYSVEGAPRGRDVPFVAGFEATPDVVLEPWMAIQSRDGTRLAATVSKPCLFLFQNMEYSCIHSAAGFGRLRPGETAKAVNKVYFVEASLGDWYKRMKSDLG